MKNKLLLGVALSGLCFSHTLWASDSLPDQISSLEGAPLPSQHIVGSERAQKIQEARDILSNNAQLLKTAYELCFKAAHSLLDNKSKTSLSDDLIEDAKRWMGSAINFGKDHNWPEGVRDDKKVVAVHFFRAATFWLQHYFYAMLPFHFLEDCDNDIFLKSAEVSLSNYARGYITKNWTDIQQTEDEVRRFGEYPHLDFKSLFIQPALSSVQKIFPFTRHTLIDPKENYLDRMQTNLQLNTDDYDNKLYQITSDFIAFYLIKNNQLTETQATEIRKLEKFRTEKARRDFITKRVYSISEDLKAFVNGIENALTPDSIKQAIEVLKRDKEEKIKISEEKKEPSDPKPSKSKRKANKKKNKKHKKSSVKHQKIDNVLPGIEDQKNSENGQDSKNKDALEHDKDHLSQGDFSNKDDAIKDEDRDPSTTVFAGPIQPQDDQEAAQTDDTKNEELLPDHENREPLQEEDDYVWDAATQRAEFERYAQLKKTKDERHDETKQKTSPYAPIPYLTQQVTEKFLDIFGNKEGDARKKNALNGYERQGWGSIDELKSVLEHAGWIFNGNYESSTISFRMPNSSKEFKAAFLKFHNDHNVGQQGMREITRHFIMKGLEFAGYTEEFLTHYHCHNFSRI